MLGYFTRFKNNVLKSLKEEEEEKELSSAREVDNLISLGVLLWVVADADEKFLPSEEKKIREVLTTYSKISEKDMPIVIRAIKEAALERIDFHKFTQDVNQNLHYDVKVGIIENLFRVACCDKDLDEIEHETIRKIAGLLKVEHKEFIDSKVKIKKEFGLKTTDQ